MHEEADDDVHEDAVHVLREEVQGEVEWALVFYSLEVEA